MTILNATKIFDIPFQFLTNMIISLLNFMTYLCPQSQTTLFNFG